MKLLLHLIVAFAITNNAEAQTSKVPSRSLSPADSAKVAGYWKKANSVRLHSQQRQMYLDSALAIAPWEAYYWQQKAMPLSKQMKHELASPYLDSAVKYNPKKWLDYRAFMKCIFSKQYREALIDFYAALELNGNSGVMDHPYYFYIGLCHLQLNNFDSCRYMMQQCIDEKTKQHGANWAHPLHWFYLGIAWYEQDNFTKAIESFDGALELNPTFPDVLYYKALCMQQLGEKSEALALAQQADSLLKKGYFINEDNARHELYPYQVRGYYLASTLKRLEEDNKIR